MRGRRAIQIRNIVLAVALLAAATAARAQTLIDGPGTISTDVTGGVVATGDPGDTLVVEAGVQVTSLGPLVPEILVLSGGYEVRNNGALSGTGVGVQFGGDTGDGASSSLINSASGSISVSLANSGVTFRETEVGAGGGQLLNEGTIQGGLYGVEIRGVVTTFTNTGSQALIEGANNGVGVLNTGSAEIFNESGARIVGKSEAGVHFNSPVASVSNNGSISGAGDAMGAVEFLGSGGKTLSNRSGGTISASGTAAGVFFAATTVGVSRITNLGTIGAEDAPAVVFEEAEESESAVLINDGTLTSASTEDPVVQMGSPEGADGARFTNSGTVTAAAGSTAPAVRMGDGDDRVTLQDGTSINGDIDGGVGVDFVLLEGSGSFDHAFEDFESLELDGTAWTLSGTSEVGDVLVASGKLTLASGGAGFSVLGELRVEDDAEFENRGLVETELGVVFGSSDDEFLNSGTLRLADGIVDDIALDMGDGSDTVILQNTGSVRGFVDGGPGDDILRLSGSGGTLSGATFGVENLEHLQMQGSSWSLSGTLFGFDDVMVSTGTLSLEDGSLLDTGVVTVEPGAMLATAVDADAMLFAALDNRGLVAPLGVSGVLNVTGDYAQASTGALQILVGSASAGRLVVDGTATLDGKLVVLSSGFTGDPIEEVVFEAGNLAADQKFEKPDDLPLLEVLVCYGLEPCPVPSVPGVNPAESPGANLVSVQLVQIANFEEVATTPNQRAVAGAVDAMLAAGVDDPAIDALFDLPDQASIDAGLDQLSPEPLGATAQLAFENARWYTALLSDRLRDARLGVEVAEWGSASGAALASLGGGGGSLFRFTPALAAPAPVATSVPAAGRQVGVWQPRATGYAVVSDLGSGEGTTGYEAVSGVLGLGAEQWTRRDLLLGAELSAAYTNLASDRDGSEFDAVAGRLAVYGSYSRGSWYVDAVAAYAYHWYDATRRIRYGSGQTAVDARADSDHGAHEVSDYLGTGLHFEIGGWDFGPEVSVQYTALIEEGYAESSADGLGLDVRSRTEDSLSTWVGARVSRPLRIDENNVVLPKLRVDWAHEWLDTSQDLAARFEVSPAGAFEVSSRSLARDAVVARVGLQAALAENLLVDVEYGVDAGRSDYLSQQVSVVFSGRF